MKVNKEFEEHLRGFKDLVQEEFKGKSSAERLADIAYAQKLLDDLTSNLKELERYADLIDAEHAVIKRGNASEAEFYNKDNDYVGSYKIPTEDEE